MVLNKTKQNTEVKLERKVVGSDYTKTSEGGFISNNILVQNLAIFKTLYRFHIIWFPQQLTE